MNNAMETGVVYMCSLLDQVLELHDVVPDMSCGWHQSVHTGAADAASVNSISNSGVAEKQERST